MSKKRTTQASFKGLVIDSSVTLAWCFPGEQDGYSQSVLDALATSPAFVPNLWHLEIVNTLIVGERRKRTTQTDTSTWLIFLSALPIIVDDETKNQAFGRIQHLAREYQLSAYDAAYLELAMRKGFPIATLDERLKTASVKSGVALYAIH